ncbi:MAG TPA: c-type cytochrome [Terracidiphilus sp.]|jgi:mono/diheme cytochrome c family protein|nr:c-type cytochrome [Terracidiphilus sp.]
MGRRLPQLFFALSLISLVLLLWAVRQASTPSWKTYQRAFFQLEAQGEPSAVTKAAVLNTRPEIHQVMLTGLQRVDRCTTCHLGVDDPTMKNAPEPFRYHEGLGPHIPSKFGCTICHGGQGLATTKEDAHGSVAFWDKPLLARGYIRASCGRCHKEGEVPGVPELTAGRHLFETQGCRGCHKLNGIGGSIGPDLTEEGASHRSPDWLERHFLAPNQVSAGSAMPNYHFTHDQARELTYYMLSLTNEDMGSYYSSVRLIPSAGYGRELFVQKDCIVCHSIGGIGAKSGPDLLGVSQRHSIAWLDEQLVNPEYVYPGSSMPEYDLETNARKALIAYMASATPDDAQAILAHRTSPLTPADVSIEAGKRNFARFGCAGCHGTELEGGLANPNAQGGQVPSLLHLSDDYTKDEILAVIRNGRAPPLENASGPTPPLYMPAWKNLLSEEDIHQLVEFLWSRQQKAKESW